MATAGPGGCGERHSPRRKQTVGKEDVRIRNEKCFFPELDRAAEIQGGGCESHSVRAHVCMSIHGGLRHEIEKAKLRHAETFPGLHQYLSEFADGEERVHKLTLRAPLWR